MNCVIINTMLKTILKTGSLILFFIIYISLFNQFTPLISEGISYTPQHIKLMGRIIVPSHQGLVLHVIQVEKYR
jgi:hypothetical protein